MDLNDLALRESFDLVLLNQVIEHVQDDEGLLRTLRGLLGPGGTLILGTTNEGCFFQRRQVRRRGTGATDHVHFYTEREIRSKIQRTGFDVAGVLREVYFLINDRIHNRLVRTRPGFALLTALTVLLPGGCSDYYFECVVRE